MSLALGRMSLPDQKKGVEEKKKPSDHKHVLPTNPNGGSSGSACLPPAVPHSVFQHIPLSTSFLPHPLNFNTCLSCFLLLSPLPSPLCQTLAAYLVITRARRGKKPFHLKDWQLSQWNTIKWLPLKRKGKFELRYAAACRTACPLEVEEEVEVPEEVCIFFFLRVLLRYLIIKGQTCGGVRRGLGKRGSSAGPLLSQICSCC